jgi:hypothetical protein
MTSTNQNETIRNQANAAGCSCSDCRCVECRCGTVSACQCPRDQKAG